MVVPLPARLCTVRVPPMASSRSSRPAQPRAAGDGRPADAVVGDLGHERAVLDLDRDRGLRRLRVLGHVGERLGDGEVDRGLDRRRGALGRTRTSTGTAAGDEAVERGAGRARRAPPVDPVARSRSSARPSRSCSEASATTSSRRALGPRLGALQRQRHEHEPLLGAVVQGRARCAAGRRRRPRRSARRGAQLVVAGPLDLALAQRLLAARRSVTSNIAPSIHSRPPDPGTTWPAIEHPAHLAVGAHDPVLQGEGQLALCGVATARSSISRSSGWTMLSSVRRVLATKFAGR
jgi:hypothetical protein